MAFTIVCILLAVCYSLLLLLYSIGWKRQPVFIIPPGFSPATKITVVIPARNESANIRHCLQSILQQQYPFPLLEVIVVDDFSEDDTAAQVLAIKDERLRLIQLSDHVTDRSALIAFKKKALSIAISAGSGALIVTTDADCTMPEQWLLHIAAKYEQANAKMIVAPVDFTGNGRVSGVFQSLDFMTMQGITAAAHSLKMGNMANGANLAFSREAYNAVNGYEGIDHLASGDDYLLMMKIHDAFPGGIAYLKSRNAIVRTLPQPDWAAFLQQRIRWASKSGKYKDHRLTAVLLLVYLFNLSFPVMLVAGFFQPFFCCLAAGLLVWKTMLELLFLLPVSSFFGKRSQLLIFPLLQPLHVVYICLAGFLGINGKFVWKGRKVR